CFSCEAAGDVFGFVSKFKNISFIEAVREVAKLTNQTIEEEHFHTDSNAEMYSILKSAVEFYKYNLKNVNKKALSYANKRGLNDKIIEEFSLGFAPEDSSVLRHLTENGFSDKAIVESGIAITSKGKMYDLLQGRLIFPILDYYGKPIGLSGRLIEVKDGPKYVNFSDTKIFNKGRVLYNFFKASSESKSKKIVYVVEGFMDVIALYKAGIKNVVAIMGTSLTTEQWSVLSSLNATIVLALDNDEPGQNAMYSIVQNKPMNVNLRVLKKFSEGKDFDEVLHKHSKEKVLEILNNTQPYIKFYYDFSKDKYNLDDLQSRDEFGKSMQKFYKTHNLSENEIQFLLAQLKKDANIQLGFIKNPHTSRATENEKSPKIKFEDATLSLLSWAVKYPTNRSAITEIVENMYKIFKTEAEKELACIIERYYRGDKSFSLETLKQEVDNSKYDENKKSEMYHLLKLIKDKNSVASEETGIESFLKQFKFDRLRKERSELNKIIYSKDEKIAEDHKTELLNRINEIEVELEQLQE
ncbi:MAG: DNA primase, partial [Bacillales bacterium]|nr:DNA primase [Bacillales bacterium]